MSNRLALPFRWGAGGNKHRRSSATSDAPRQPRIELRAVVATNDRCFSNRTLRGSMVRLLFVFATGLALLAVASCSEDYSPTAPPAPAAPAPPVSTTGSFTGNILDADTHRMCIDNARAEILSGPRSGTVYPQNRAYCDDPGAGFTINDLPVGTVLRLRASAPGYTSAEGDFVIASSGWSVDINLKRAE